MTTFLRRLPTFLISLAVGFCSMLFWIAPADASSGDRAQLSNYSHHNLGVFATYKKDPPGSAGQFYVLAPGHETDDDYNLIAVLVPPQVSLSWVESGSLPSSSTSRLLPIGEGEQLQITDREIPGADPQPVNYELNLPAAGLEATLPSIADLPSFTQAELDQQPETAPLD